MMLNYGMFFSLMGSLLVCLWLTRENVKLKKRNFELCCTLSVVGEELNSLKQILHETNESISNKLDDIESGFIDEVSEDYSRMAEHLACIREEEADRAKEEILLKSIEG